MLEFINSIVWGKFLLIFLLFTGIRLTIKTRFFQIRGFGKMLKSIKKMLKPSKNGISPFAALSTALSGTMGTGGIIGVGAAISLGGAGALFWMFISALLCMIIKYAEVSLAMKYREKHNGEYCGGAMYCIKNGMSGKAYILSIVFSAAVMLTSFGIGAATQSGAASSTFSAYSGKIGFYISAAMCVAAACVIFGTAKSITIFTSFLVPIMTLTYFIGAAFALVKFHDRIPDAVSQIFNSAFSANAAGGGLVGFFTSAAARHGVAKGLFTNEAGMGSAPLIHSAADNTAYNQGFCGMLEVFLDTIVVCTLSGIVILITDSENSPAEFMTAAAFSKVFGSFGTLFIAISVTLFAFGAMIGWCCYGTAACKYLFKRKSAEIIYKILFCIAIFGGALLPLSNLLEISDLLNAFMAIPNLIMINSLCNDVVQIIKNKE